MAHQNKLEDHYGVTQMHAIQQQAYFWIQVAFYGAPTIHDCAFC